MSHTYVGLTPRFLVNGRPVVFGDVLTDDDLALADQVTKASLAPPLDGPVEVPTAPETPAPQPSESAPSPTPLPATDNPEPEAK